MFLFLHGHLLLEYFSPNPSLSPSLPPSFPPGESHSSSYSHQQVLQLVKSRSKEQRLGVLLAGQSRKDHNFVNMQASRGREGEREKERGSEGERERERERERGSEGERERRREGERDRVERWLISTGQRALLSTHSTDPEPHEGWHWNGTRFRLHLCRHLEHGYRHTRNTPLSTNITGGSIPFQVTRVLRETSRPGSVPSGRGRLFLTPWPRLTTSTPSEHRYCLTS